MWKARAVAKATRHLSLLAAGYVDRAVVDQISALPWGRFQDLLEATTYQADPQGADQLSAMRAADRYVSTGRSTRYGLKTLIARANAGDHDHVSVRSDPFNADARRLDEAKLRPPVTLYLHQSAEALVAGHGVVRMEDVGPVLLARLRKVLGSQAQIRLQPVVDPTDHTPVDAYEIPHLTRERIRLRNPVESSPGAPSEPEPATSTTPPPT